jgi:alcohol dehydrogenase (cytochrome c)
LGIRRKLPEDVGRFLIVLSINRNLAIYGDLIIDTSVDDFVYALDARTGKLAWENRIVDYREDSAQEPPVPSLQMAESSPGDKYKATPSGCIITAHDAKTGKELWRTRTIPKPGEPGNETWGDAPDANRRHVGVLDGTQFRPPN